MRYLLPLLLTLFALFSYTALAEEGEDESVTTVLIEDGAYLCHLTGAEDTVDLGSGCFVFEDSKDAYGRAIGVLEIVVPAGTFSSRWKCSDAASDPEERVQCYGYGMDGYTFTGQGSGALKRNAGEGEPDLVLDTAGITGAQIGTVGVARCFVDPECEPES